MSSVATPRPQILRARPRRPQLSQEALLLLVSLLLSLGCNLLFWDALLQERSWLSAHTWLLAGATLALITALHFVLLSLVSSRHSIKPVLMLVSVTSVAAALYMQRYTVYFDAHMLANVLHTQPKEALELIEPGLLLRLLLFSAPLLVLIGATRITARPWPRALLRRAVALLAALLVLIAAVAVGYRDLSSLLRNRHEARYLVTPANLIVGSIRVVLSDARSAQQPRTPIASDARRSAPAATTRPRLLLLVVGETVRSDHWGLSGYARQTTPELAARGLINFADVTACGSSTEVSLPCMFNPVGRRDYDEARIRREQSVLHVLDRVGISTLWIDNQTGCKGVCDGLPSIDIAGDADPALCDGEVCLDEVLLAPLRQALAEAKGDRVIVLHPLGNHGPAYSRRYPAAFARFQPSCASVDLGSCSAEAIGNSYDNAVLYSDHVMARAIDLLKAADGIDSGFLYVSDHGESLGEHGLYLHGVPYAMAPIEQTRVPLALWLSDGLAAATGIDRACLAARRAEPLAHDHLAHSLLGLFDLQTAIYQPGLDIFAGCRPNAPTSPSPPPP